MPLVDDLRGVLGPDRVKDSPLDLRLYNRDAGVTPGVVLAVAFPETTQEVAAIVRVAARWGVPVVPRGAGTGLAGGAVSEAPGLIVSMMRMNRIWDVDRAGHTAWVGPGVINLDLSTHTNPMGLHYAPDPSSQSVCTIGGNVGTNAGGPHCLAEGTTVAHILGVEFVTADGEVVVLGGAAPDPLGFDLRAVVVGSEGTLGLVTKVLVKLTENPPDVRTLLLAFPDVMGAAHTVSNTIAAGIIPAALEMMDKPMVEAVENFVHAGYPTDAAAVLLAEVAGHPSAVAAESEIIAQIARDAGATEVRIAVDDAERNRLWLGRKSAFGAVAQAAPDYYLHDTVVPRTRLPEVMERLYGIAEEYDILMLNVFHAGDGNLHPLMAFDGREPGVMERVIQAGDEIVRLSIAVGGSLSGEHGIGLEKRKFMGEVFDAVSLDAQARLRDAFDPAGTMNPGKVLPEGSRCFDFDFPVAVEAV
ncbi:MAG TPA: FAD-linked oxidase C-terminal domain-containing protein [Acidimicrobiia bacterium]|jgi:glycolate oxidase|nr:FAD-linked oxidase C-terminal domain-containing protein [Acidimicrobiia bacterium]